MSDDRTARIQARRARIEGTKHDAERNGEVACKESKDEGGDSLSVSKQQTVDSIAEIEALKYNSTHEVTRVRSEATMREALRRTVEETKRDERLTALRDEAVHSIEKNEQVDKQWEALTSVHMPQQLKRQIDEQQKLCTDILASKDKLIRQFRLELKAKDEEYIKMLKHQSEDVETLLRRMDEQTKALQTRYEEALRRIEEAHIEERADLIDEKKGEIARLFDERRKMELQFMDANERKEHEYMDDIMSMRTRDSEEYNKLKIKLETDIQILEQQLQEMRATYQLNSEKLEYNYLIYIERDMENRSELKQKERRVLRLKEQLASLIQRYKKEDKTFKARNETLTDEYMRATHQYKDLQKKFRHFQTNDVQTFRRVWEMHEREVRGLADAVLKADRVITEQQLGFEWRPPRTKIGSTSRGIFASRGGLSTRAGTRTAGTTDAGAGANAEQSSLLAASGGRVRTEKIRRALAMLRSEASFLVSEEDRKSGDVDAQNAGIVRALQINSDEDMDDLLSYFYSPDGDGNEELYEEDETMEMGHLGLIVRPDDVVYTIQQYMDDKNELSLRNGDKDAIAATVATKKKAKKISDETKTRHLRSKDAMFWEGMANAASDRTVRVWTALESALEKYNAVLSERAGLSDEVCQLRMQNGELKGLLNQYLGADVNADLHIPPARTIRLHRSGSSGK